MHELDVKLLSFNSYDEEIGEESFMCTNKEYVVQMFGLNKEGEKICIKVRNFRPYFYIKIGEDWGIKIIGKLIRHLNKSVKDTMKNKQIKGMGYYEGGIVGYTTTKKKKLYGFNGGKLCRFLKLKFINEQVMKKYRGLYYFYEKINNESVRKIKRIECNGYKTEIYESQIPSLLRLFHEKNIQPSGWIQIPLDKIFKIEDKKTDCEYEYEIDYKYIISNNNKEDVIPYKIASFDIEASSSHGDFPLAKKNYKKLSEEIVDVWAEEMKTGILEEENYLKDIFLTAFGFNYEPIYNISRVFTKKDLSESFILNLINYIINKKYTHKSNLEEIEELEEINSDNEDEEENIVNKRNKKIIKMKIIEILNDIKITRLLKIESITKLLDSTFPKLEGDKVTFIGTTFWKYGDKEPYLNNCLVLDTCDNLKEIENCRIDTFKNEKDLLLGWTKLIKEEDPDIITGYNIFGFDYPFMYTRTQELNISPEFLKLSRNKNEICWNKDWKTGKIGIEELKITIASGQHDLKFIKMAGRVNIDMYNFFRRDYNLSSYKLDFVASNFISDTIKNIEHIDNKTKIYSQNLSGLEKGSYVNFIEEIHSEDKYKDGAKFKVIEIDKINSSFIIDSKENLDTKKKLRWGLSKDDVSPQDIFRMTNEGPKERYLIAKYCIQDCNLVHYLMNKMDVITGYVEMASLCSVPIEYLVLRGQGIKLTSFIAKKCKEKKTLMPDLDKADLDEGYEGAIVLPPKRDLYLNEPVACVDFSSLYPSSMISENISPDSKVWTKEYDLEGNVVYEKDQDGNDKLDETGNRIEKIYGERDESGNFIYDNLEGYTYVDITYDTYIWKRKSAKGAMEKIKIGFKTCRFAQFPNNELGILPSILKECLIARKTTRKLIPLTKDEFMKRILDSRQLSIKLTANSIYGQTGAKTSTFYERDVAASTTAMGRKLLIYGKNIIESCYIDKTYNIENKIITVENAEYVYGDTDSVFFKFNLKNEEGKKIIDEEALKITIKLAKEAGQLATSWLKEPHDLEYEKTFWPFCLLSKKRYTGILYEEDVNKGKQKSMGIVLKRRDNAPIVKDIYGGIIDILMKDKNIEKASDFLKMNLDKLMKGEVPIQKLIITKSLRGSYKNPKQIAHKVLADRIGLREPGNKPSPGDRIPYVYFKNENKNILQGDKIELPEYIINNKLQIDYEHYVTNQIMKPVQQLFALVLEKMPEFQKSKGESLYKWNKQIETLKEKYTDKDEFEKKYEQLRNKEVESLMFTLYLKPKRVRKKKITVDDFYD
tara:strand:- start:1625 stop:5449 length:3825 start_codon:yes stop_codon:yes gene_type:complete